MRDLKTVAALLVVLAALPVAGAQMSSSAGSGASATASASESTVQTQSGITNYTNIYIDDKYSDFSIKPGNSETFSLTVENREDSPVTVRPRLSQPPVPTQNFVDSSWLEIGTGETTLEPDDSEEFEFTVNVPDDAELGNYDGRIVFTNETVSYPGRPSRHVHTANFNVDVWREPTVKILSDTYLHTQVKAGGSVTRQIRIENTGESSVPLNPEMGGRDRNVVYSRDTPGMIDRSWLSIDAPTEIDSGETASVELTVSPPSSVNRGDYRGELNLGIKDPTRQSENNYWQNIRLRTEVWKQPSDSFEVPFSVDSNTTEVRVKITSQSAYGETAQRPEVDFDVSLTSPRGDEVQPEESKTTDKGHVNLGNGGARDSQTVGEYGVAGSSKEFVYSIENPSSGEWKADIMPHNTMRFDYEVTRYK